MTRPLATTRCHDVAMLVADIEGKTFRTFSLENVYRPLGASHSIQSAMLMVLRVCPIYLRSQTNFVQYRKRMENIWMLFLK